MQSLASRGVAVTDDQARSSVDHHDHDAGEAFRLAMRRVVSGVTIITTKHDDMPWGMTVSAFTPVCMEPPTLLVCVNGRTVTAEDIARDRRFAVNVLSQSQREVSQICSRQGERKFLHAHVVEDAAILGGARMPVLQESLVTFDCRAFDVMRSGTHIIAIARVETVIAPEGLEPLLYGQGRYLRGSEIA